MGMIATIRPLIDEDTFRRAGRVPGPTMTLEGTTGKTLLLLGLLLLGAVLGSFFPHAAYSARVLHPAVPWVLYARMSVPFIWPGILALVLAIIGAIAWYSDRAQVFWMMGFAIVEGMCMVSLALAADTVYPGVGLVAAAATVAMLVVILGLYYLGFIRDVDPLAVGVIGFFVTILAGLGVVSALRAFGVNISYPRQTALVLWAIICGVMVFLAQQLALSFRYIEEGVETGAPKWCEWRAAFGLMISLVWIYIVLFDVLRLVLRSAKSKS
jgi:uncharacterized YccA/Bax inhibitor family protein